MRTEHCGLTYLSKEEHTALRAVSKALTKRKVARHVERAGADNFRDVQRMRMGAFRRANRDSRGRQQCGSREEMLTGKKSPEQLAEMAKKARIAALKAAWAKTA